MNLTNSKYFEQGLNWYSNALGYCASLAMYYDLTIEQTCGIVAALSPAVSWETNKSDADILIKRYPKKTVCSTYGLNVKKARRIIKGENVIDVLRGLKVPAFYESIISPVKQIPYASIDTWSHGINALVVNHGNG